MATWGVLSWTRPDRDSREESTTVDVRRLGRRSRTVVGSLAVLALVAGLFAAVTRTATANPPPNPTNGQLNNAKARKDALSAQVGRLSGQIGRASCRERV